MNYSPCTYEFSGVSTRIVSYSNIPLDTLEQILSIRKLAFIDRKKWDIKSYQGSDYEWDEYDDPTHSISTPMKTTASPAVFDYALPANPH